MGRIRRRGYDHDDDLSDEISRRLARIEQLLVALILRSSGGLSDQEQERVNRIYDKAVAESKKIDAALKK